MRHRAEGPADDTPNQGGPATTRRRKHLGLGTERPPKSRRAGGPVAARSYEPAEASEPVDPPSLADLDLEPAAAFARAAETEPGVAGSHSAITIISPTGAAEEIVAKPARPRTSMTSKPQRFEVFLILIFLVVVLAVALPFAFMAVKPERGQPDPRPTQTPTTTTVVPGGTGAAREAVPGQGG